MRYYEMKQHAAAAYLHLVEGCDRVLYDVDVFKGKDFEVDLIGMRDDELAILIDLADKFAHYPREMKQRTLRRKLIQRYLTLKRVLASQSEVQRLELWYFGTPSEKLELVVPSVQELLTADYNITLTVLSPDDVRKRIAIATRAVQNATTDHSNPFVQALLISRGVIEAPDAGAVEMPTALPIRLPTAHYIPEFVNIMLQSDYVVNWLKFDVPAFDFLQSMAREHSGMVWDELVECLSAHEVRFEVTELWEIADEDEFDWEELDWEDLPTLEPRRYSVEEIVQTLEVLLHSPRPVLAVWQRELSNSMLIKIEYMLPYVFKHPLFSVELIEAEIVHFGGDRDLVRSHLYTPRPDKRPYRGAIVIELANRLEDMRFSDAHKIAVPIRDPTLPNGVVASLWLTYQPSFAGYFHLTFDALLPFWRKICGDE